MADDSVRRALEALTQGEPVVVYDPDREGEADLVMAASTVTDVDVAFYVRYTSGILCVPMSGRRADGLGLPPMVEASSDPLGTAFTISVDAAATGTGVSAADRARTIRALADPTTDPASLRRHGHVFPLRARPGGLRERAGHTEAALELLALAGLAPVALISELQADDGTMLGADAAQTFAAAHAIPHITIDELRASLPSSSVSLRRGGEANLPTLSGEFRAIAYTGEDGLDHLALTLGDLTTPEPVLTRIHSECLTGDLLGSIRCDCGSQLRRALDAIAEAGRGVLVYLRGHEGRGIGLGAKIRAYELQDAGADTVAANLALGLPVDARRYDIAAGILADLGVAQVRLLTNNPAKQEGLVAGGIEVVERVPLIGRVHAENVSYLKTKQELLGHHLGLPTGAAGRAKSA